MKKEELKLELSQKVDMNLYKEIEALFAKYGIENIKVNSIEVSSTTIEALDKAECEAKGGIWSCKNRPGQPPYCRCLRRV